MTLSQIIINELVKSRTNAFISESTFAVLRQNLLDQAPLSAVVTAINSLLSEHCTADKLAFKDQATRLACDTQNRQDAQDAISDKQEEDNERSLKGNYQTEITGLEQRLPGVQTKYFHQQQLCNQIKAQLQELRGNLTLTNQSIDIIRSNRLAQSVSYPYSYQCSRSNIHSHPITCSPFYNDPFNYQLSTLNRPFNTPYYSSFNAPFNRSFNRPFNSLWNYDGLIQEQRLLGEQLRLTQLIAIKESEKTSEEQTLFELVNEKEQITARINQLKNKLNTEFPNNEQRRQIRSQERMVREQARQTDDPNLKQLSLSNLNQLKQQISNKNIELDCKKRQLMDATIKTSYLTYTAQLEQILKVKTGPKISFSERESLKMILNLMKNHMKMKEREQIMIKALCNERNNLQLLRKTRADNQKQLHCYDILKPRIKLQNGQIGGENVTLKRERDSAASYRNIALVTSLFGLGSSLVTAGLVSALFISPVLFVIPGVLALLTVISLTFAGVYHFQKIKSNDQILRNEQTMHENEKAILTQDEKTREISLVTIPNLNEAIDKAEKAIAQMEKQLKNHQGAIEQLFRKAESMTSTQGATSTLFSKIHNNVVSIHPLPVHVQDESDIHSSCAL